MSYIEFESAKEKEKIRDELRKAREELLKRAKQNAAVRAEKVALKTLSGEATWMLPDLAKKLDKADETKKNKKSSKKSKKQKKEKKSKKKKRNRKHSTSDSSDTEDEIPKKKRKKKRKMSTSSSSSSSTSSEEGSKDEWVDKASTQPAVRDDWMTSPMLLKTFSKDKPQVKKQVTAAYDPGKSSRELNPHWKDGGSGMPAFLKPSEDFDDVRTVRTNTSGSRGTATGGWKKVQEPSVATRKLRTPSPSSSSPSEDEAEQAEESILTDQQMNELGAKIIKAEIMGNTELAEDLKKKIENARQLRKQTKTNVTKELSSKTRSKNSPKPEDEHVLLTTTDNKGTSRPLLRQSEKESGRSKDKRKQKAAETHVSGERVRYFPDDDKYDIKQMFEREKYTSAADSDAQFAEIAGRHKNPNDDLEDIFADKVRRDISDHASAEKEKQRAIHEHEKLTKMLDNCDKCFDSQKMQKQLIVSMGTKAYLALPWHEGLQTNHCLIVPMQHVPCSTQLDEDTWEEISDYRKALTKMFADHKQDVVFFETARYLHKRPHMVIHCVPASSMEMAPFYFKKAIQESEDEWSTNKQLVSLKEKGLRRSIPKGLPYFWVNFGMDSGFAHVIEDQEKFPSNFAQEIIGGMLNLDARRWRCPRKEQNFVTKVKNLAHWWKPFDFTDH